MRPALAALFVLLAGCASWGSREGRVDGGRAYRVECHADARGPLVERWEVEGLEHAWSGGPGTYADPKAPEATRALWSFFQGRSGCAPPP